MKAAESVGGCLLRKPLTEIMVQEWNQEMSINLKADFLSAREALRGMGDQ